MTLSSAQLARLSAPRPRRLTCTTRRRVGLDDDFGSFDAVASLGAFEHFCSYEEYLSGEQERIYADLFEHVAALLPEGGRFYLQTMVFGRKMIDTERVSIDAPRDSDEWYLALMMHQFPGSFLPFGEAADRARRGGLAAPGLERERPARLHRDDPPVAAAVRRAEPAQDAAQGRGSSRAG